MLTFDKKYFCFAVALFIIEVLIAVYLKDGFIRSYVGDFLVVMLIYCAVRTFINISPLKLAVGTLLFSYLIEVLQYFRLVEVVGLQKNEIARTVIGTGFDWIDLVAYTLGVISILWLERSKFRGVKKSYI